MDLLQLAGILASGYYSVTMGHSTTASDWGSLVIGRYNSSSSSATSADSFSTSNPAFVIGNGTANSARSDAFKVMFNGDVTTSGSMTVGADYDSKYRWYKWSSINN